MTGPEHYQLAEDLLRSPGCDMQGIAEAQVHGILALAAATAIHGVILPLPAESDYAAGWHQAIGVPS